MGTRNAPETAGRQGGSMLRRETDKEEREVEAEKGSALRKGEDRFEERAARGRRGIKPSD